MADPYRFGGPIPESVLSLQKRRRFRDSSLYAGVKKIRCERAEEERAAQYEHDAKTGVARVHLLSSDKPINLDLQREQAKTALAPFRHHDAPAIPGLLPLCAWRIDGPDFSRPGFTTDFEQVKFWVRRGAVVTPLHQPSEDGKSRTVSGAIVARLAELPTDPWGCPLPESASTAGAVSQLPVTHCGSHLPSACPSGCRARSLDPDLSALEAFEEIAARARDFRLG